MEEWRRHSTQSPIILKHDESNEYDLFDPLEFFGHWDNEGSAIFTNNGYTGQLIRIVCRGKCVVHFRVELDKTKVY